MIDILNSYLVQHKSISIPGLGTLVIERHPAYLNEGTRQLMPAAFTYKFDKFHDTPSKDFFLFIARQKKIREYEAIRLYDEFAAAFTTSFKMNDMAEWKEAGTFRKDAAGEIIFEPLTKPFTLFSPIEAAPVSPSLPAGMIATPEAQPVTDDAAAPVETHEHPDVAKQTWWIYALALFTAAVMMLSIHFYNKGFSWQALFSQLPIN